MTEYRSVQDTIEDVRTVIMEKLATPAEFLETETTTDMLLSIPNIINAFIQKTPANMATKGRGNQDLRRGPIQDCTYQ